MWLPLTPYRRAYCPGSAGVCCGRFARACRRAARPGRVFADPSSSGVGSRSGDVARACDRC